MAKTKNRVLSKKEFVIKQISRTNKKNYENYVVTRIIHLLDDLDIKFVTQQFFKREDGSFGLSDLYFPQFNLSIEIDEGQHENSIKQDKVRDQDYLLATQDLLQHAREWMPKRVKVYGDISLKQIDKEVGNIVDYIKSLKQKTLKDGSFVKWDFDKEFDYSDKKIFVAGDHILKDITPNISLWSDDENLLNQYLASLDRVYKLDVELVLPGHRDIIRDCKRRIRELKRHHELRAEEILSILEKGSDNAYGVTSQMDWDMPYESWDISPVIQRWFATGEAIAHLKYLEERELVQREMSDQKIFFSKKS